MYILVYSVIFVINYAHFSAGSVCENVVKTERTIHEDFCDSPLYLTLSNDEEDKELDHACYKIMPTLKKDEFVTYGLLTYKNKTIDSITYLMKQISPGYFSIASNDFAQVHVKIGDVCDTMLEFTCGGCGEDYSFAVGVSSKYGKLDEDCQERAKQKFASQKLNADNLIALPMHYQPNCPEIPTSPEIPIVLHDYRRGFTMRTTDLNTFYIRTCKII